MIYDITVESEYYCQKCKRVHQTRVKGFTIRNQVGNSNFPSTLGGSGTVLFRVEAISLGSSPNLILKILARFTANANGQVTVDFQTIDASCAGTK